MPESDYIASLHEGQGVNLDQQELKGIVVTGKLAPTIPSADGLTVIFDLSVMKSQDELLSSLSITGDVKYSGVFKASAQASFLQSSRISRYRSYVVARCTVRLPDESLQNPLLLDEAKAYAATVSRDKFIHTYGTHFLYGIRKGGYYYGIIEVDSATAEEQRDLAVAVSASGWGTSANVNVAQRLSKATSNLSTRVFSISIGGPDSLEQPDSIDKMIQQAAGFPAIASKHPAIVSGIYVEYESFFPIKFKDEPGEFGWMKRRDDIGILGRRYIRLKELRSDFQYVIDHYRDYATGAGVIFQLGSEKCDARGLGEVRSEALVGLVCEAVGAEGRKGSLPLTVENIKNEMAELEEAIDKVVLAADNCRIGEPYQMPPPFVSRISLPEILEKNMELERIKTSLVPKGTIAMWSGAADALPEGWALCDGRLGTPDLRGRFVLGASESARVNECGEPAFKLAPVSENVKLKMDTSKGGSHHHWLPEGWYGARFDAGDDRYGITMDQTYPQRPGRAGVDPAGEHTHEVLLVIKSLCEMLPSAEVLKPKWYALCFIMKV